MSAEAIINVTAEAVKNASTVAKLKDVATKHPIAAAGTAAVVTGLAAYGGYKLLQAAFTKSEKS